MGCLSLGFVEQLAINLVIIFAVVAVIRLLIPLLVGLLEPLMGGGAAIIGQIITIILYAIICIFVIYIVFGLLSCLIGSGGGFSLIPHR